MTESTTRPCFVGFDTSNYTTSAAACTMDERGLVTVIANCKAPLPVEAGARGLRQSDAVFAHTRNLPPLVRELREILARGNYRPQAVGVSMTPRDAEGSYMPCFLCGAAAAEAFAAGGNLPLFRFSHQGGHIMAALYSSGAMYDTTEGEGGIPTAPFLAFHVSGGTTEAVVATPDQDPTTGRPVGFSVELVGAGVDLHAGQLIDRIGVLMGLEFPCGPAMEALAVTNRGPLPPVKLCVKGGEANLSGLENQAAALWQRTGDAPLVSAYVLTAVGRTLRRMTDHIQAARREAGKEPLSVLYAGGVMSNRFIRPLLADSAPWRVFFSEPAFSADNAAGVAILCAMRAQRA